MAEAMNSSSTRRLTRFTPAQRLWHLALIVVFMTMAVTGMAWMYVETPWGLGLAGWFGGIKNTLQIHRIMGLVLIALFAGHILWMLTRIRWSGWSRVRDSLFGPDSIVFLGRDVADFFRHLAWIFGLRKKPAFERWSWWEKFDYWAVWWGFFIVGVTGLMLYDTVLTSDYLPGWTINVVAWIHRIESILAMGHVFTVHFLVEHFRPQAFPFNGSMFHGAIPLDEAREDHGKWVERLAREGRLTAESAGAPPVWLRILYFGFGYAVIGLGVFLLVFGIANAALLTLF